MCAAVFFLNFYYGSLHFIAHMFMVSRSNLIKTKNVSLKINIIKIDKSVCVMPYAHANIFFPDVL